MALEWNRTYTAIEAKYKEAYRVIEQAIGLEEEERPFDALQHYTHGVRIINEALNILVELPEDPDQIEHTQWVNACKMIHRMERTSDEVHQRITHLRQILGIPSHVDTTPEAAPTDEATDFSQKMSENIVRGAYHVSNTMVRGAEKASDLMTYTTPYLMSKMAKAPDDVAPVSENVRTGVELAKSVTGAAASATCYIAGNVGSATMALGRFLAPHVHRQGTRLLSYSMDMNSEEAQRKMTGALTVAAGAVEGLGTVYAGIESSAAILGHNISNNSVKIIEHKYGPSAADVAADTFDTMGNVINFSQHINVITPKGLVKRSAKSAGRALVADFTPNIPEVAGGQKPPHFNDGEAKLRELEAYESHTPVIMGQVVPDDALEATEGAASENIAPTNLYPKLP